MTTCMVANDVMHYIMRPSLQTTDAGVKIIIENYNNFILVPSVTYDPSKKMYTHTLSFCALKRKLKTFENLRWTYGVQPRKQRKSIYILYFHM